MAASGAVDTMVVASRPAPRMVTPLSSASEASRRYSPGSSWSVDPSAAAASTSRRSALTGTVVEVGSEATRPVMLAVSCRRTASATGPSGRIWPEPLGEVGEHLLPFALLRGEIRFGLIQGVLELGFGDRLVGRVDRSARRRGRCLVGCGRVRDRAAGFVAVGRIAASRRRSTRLHSHTTRRCQRRPRW